MTDLKATVPDDEIGSLEDRFTSPECPRVGCASSSTIVEKTAEKPSAKPSSDDCYTTLLHNPDNGQGLTLSERSGKRSAG